MTKTSTRHNHDPKPFGALVAPGECPRCDERRAERAAEGIVDHNHARLPFGQRKPVGECPRCDQLHDGAKPRPSADPRQRAAAEDARRLEEWRRHAASQRHRENGCNDAWWKPGTPGRGVCTFGES